MQQQVIDNEVNIVHFCIIMLIVLAIILFVIGFFDRHLEKIREKIINNGFICKGNRYRCGGDKDLDNDLYERQEE